MRCKFCFGTCSFKNLSSSNEQKELTLTNLKACADANIEKVTFVGGEPLLCNWLEEAIETAHNLGLTTCVVSNGSLVSRHWLKKLSHCLDWIGYSIDSVTESTNIKSGRATNGHALSENHYRSIIEWSHEYNIKLKLNTTVTQWNKDEDMSSFLLWTQAHRIKMFQAVTIDGINETSSNDFSVTNEEFEKYIIRHQREGLKIIPEYSSDMQGSYLMVSPDGRFFDSTSGKYTLGRAIQNVGFHNALSDVQYDPNLFQERGGLYKW